MSKSINFLLLGQKVIEIEIVYVPLKFINRLIP